MNNKELFERCRRLGIPLTNQFKKQVVKSLSPRIRAHEDIDDADILMVFNRTRKVPQHYQFVSYTPICVQESRSTGFDLFAPVPYHERKAPSKHKLEVEMRVGDEWVRGFGEGKSQVSAVCRAVQSVMSYRSQIDGMYSGSINSEKTNGSSVVRVRAGSWNVIGHGSHEDPTRQVIDAVIDGYNRMSYVQKERPKGEDRFHEWHRQIF